MKDGYFSYGSNVLLRPDNYGKDKVTPTAKNGSSEDNLPDRGHLFLDVAICLVYSLIAALFYIGSWRIKSIHGIGDVITIAMLFLALAFNLIATIACMIDLAHRDFYGATMFVFFEGTVMHAVELIMGINDSMYGFTPSICSTMLMIVGGIGTTFFGGLILAVLFKAD